MANNECLCPEYSIRTQKRLSLISEKLNAAVRLIYEMRTDLQAMSDCSGTPENAREIVDDLNRIALELCDYICEEYADAARGFDHVTNWAIKKDNLTPAQIAVLWEMIPDYGASDA